MAYSIRHPLADQDVRETWLFLARIYGPERADTFIERLEQVCALLAEHPHMGRSREDLGPGLRSYPVGPQFVIYYPLDDGVAVARVLDGRRDIAAVFGED